MGFIVRIRFRVYRVRDFINAKKIAMDIGGCLNPIL